MGTGVVKKVWTEQNGLFYFFTKHNDGCLLPI